MQETTGMRLSMIGAAALLATISAGPAIAQAAPASKSATTAPTVKVSKQATKAIGELQTAVNAKDKANIPAKLAAAKAVASTKDDRYLIARLELQYAAAADDSAAAAEAIDALAQSGMMQPKDMASLYNALGGTYFNAKQYDQAVAAYQRQIAIDPHNLDALTMIAQSRAAQGKPADALSALQQAIQASSAAGQKPDEALYQRSVKIAYEGKLPNAPEIARAWLAAYPTPTSWHDAVAIYRNSAHPDMGGTLDLLRLMRANGALTRTEDFVTYVTAANELNNFAEAQAVLAEGLAANKIEATNPLVAEVKAKPKPTLSDLAAAASSAQSGRALIGIGDRYYGLGEYAKAAETYRKAMAKGGDTSLANLHLGMALARAGNQAGATSALNAVTGPDAGIAKFWLLYAQQHG
jgi:tetratricopeptide (TPR) repeat protein